MLSVIPRNPLESETRQLKNSENPKFGRKMNVAAGGEGQTAPGHEEPKTRREVFTTKIFAERCPFFSRAVEVAFKNLGFLGF